MRLLLAVAVCVATCVQAAPEDEDDAPPGRTLPRALQALVPEGQEVLAWRRADLNLDGRADVVFILQASGTHPYDGDRGDLPRPLVVALGSADGRLQAVLSNKHLVRCKNCGGTWPEPFEALDAEAGRVTLRHYGGSRWRWSEAWRFDFDARANTWFLSSVRAGSDTADEGHLVRTYVRGRHFGALRLSTLRPEHFTAWRSDSKVPQPRGVRDAARS